MVPVCRGVETDKFGDEAIRTAGTVHGPNLYNEVTARQPKRRKKTVATTRDFLERVGDKKYVTRIQSYSTARNQRRLIIAYTRDLSKKICKPKKC